jgi:2-dehydro-3-deoxyphosphooctonate aldolase (KDO 8-P synthase)
MEVHDAPERAPSDGPNMLPLARMGALLESLRDIQALVTNMEQSTRSKEASS